MLDYNRLLRAGVVIPNTGCCATDCPSFFSKNSSLCENSPLTRIVCSNYVSGFFRSIFWWSGVASPHTPASGADAFEKLVFASDVFGGDLQEFDDEWSRYHAMLDACQVPQHAQAIIFSGTIWRILQAQDAQIPASAR